VRSRSARVMTTLMRNGRDRRSENPRSATRTKSACFWLGPISGSHQGQQPKRLHSKAGYMAAPERFAETSDSPLALRAPSIHAGAVHTWHYPEACEGANEFRSLGCCGPVLLHREFVSPWPKRASLWWSICAATWCCMDLGSTPNEVTAQVAMLRRSTAPCGKAA
jgi:hypothetical protein